MKFGVLVFPGSNCDHDTYHVLAELAGQPTVMLWHDSPSLENCDAILVPGGFAYGDYLRTGAIARFSPVMQSVARFAAARWPGPRYLQRLPDPVRGRHAARRAAAQRRAEVHLQAGAPAHRDLRFHVYQRSSRRARSSRCRSDTWKATTSVIPRPWTCLSARIASPSATPPPRVEITPEANPNGSLSNIAGILNQGRNVLGMMPHPDRSSEAILGSSDGFAIFASLMNALATHQESGSRR